VKVADIMTRSVVTVRHSATVAQAAKLMQQRGVHALIVLPSYEQDAYGIVTISDVVGKVIAQGRNPQRMRVFEIMTKPCIVLNPDLSVEYAAQLLANAHLHSAPVIQTKLLGVLSVTDILKRSEALAPPQTVELANEIQHLSMAAYQICREQGPGSQACAEAWAVVDALQAEIDPQLAASQEKTAFENFSDEFPEALRDRDYDAWCGG
jgi:CBS domain-containing protein